MNSNSRPARHRLIHVETRSIVRAFELDRVVHHVARDDRALTARLDRDAHVPRRVARCGTQLELRADRMVRLNQVDEPGIDDRLHGVVHVIEIVVAVRVLEHRPVLVFLAPE